MEAEAETFHGTHQYYCYTLASTGRQTIDEKKEFCTLVFLFVCHNTHTRTHTHTHTHTRTRTHTHTHTRTHAHTRTHTHTHTHVCACVCVCVVFLFVCPCVHPPSSCNAWGSFALSRQKALLLYTQIVMPQDAGLFLRKRHCFPAKETYTFPLSSDMNISDTSCRSLSTKKASFSCERDLHICGKRPHPPHTYI